MTFFNKKTEVMQIEMTPYGRYLYSVGKFKPHSYEFVDDDILYKASGSTENQEDIHARILEQTPKLKINRAFQDNDYIVNEVENGVPFLQSQKIQKINKMDIRQNSLFALGRSSYNSDSVPSFQVSVYNGEITGSTTIFSGSNGDSGSVFIPQIDVDFNINATIKNELQESSNGKEFVSRVYPDGRYVELAFNTTVIHIKEFNSFYEKDNFEIEVFKQSANGKRLEKLKMPRPPVSVINNMLVTPGESGLRATEESFQEEGRSNNKFSSFYFTIDADDQIPAQLLCETVGQLEVINQFLDSEIECPDQRVDRFNIYATRVSATDLEDCD